MNELAPRVTEDQLIEVLQHSIYPGARPESIKLALGYCKAAGLDPMQKPLHIVPMRTKVGTNPDGSDKWGYRDVIMPGVNLYRTQAASTRSYAGMSPPEFGPMKKLMVKGERGELTELEGFEFPEYCRITVLRIVEGEPREFTAIEFWEENYATAKKDTDVPNDMWRRRPRGQLAKCTEAQALRKAFPERTGAPTAEEMAGKTLDDDPNVIEGGHVAAARREPQSKSQARRMEAQAPAPAPEPASAASGNGDAEDLSNERAYIERKVREKKLDLAPLLAEAGIESLSQLTRNAFNIIRPLLTQ
jgi:phage recombination protein Bet